MCQTKSNVEYILASSIPSNVLCILENAAIGGEWRGDGQEARTWITSELKWIISMCQNWTETMSSHRTNIHRIGLGARTHLRPQIIIRYEMLYWGTSQIDPSVIIDLSSSLNRCSSAEQTCWSALARTQRPAVVNIVCSKNQNDPFRLKELHSKLNELRYITCWRQTKGSSQNWINFAARPWKKCVGWNWFNLLFVNWSYWRIMFGRFLVGRVCMQLRATYDYML